MDNSDICMRKHDQAALKNLNLNIHTELKKTLDYEEKILVNFIEHDNFSHISSYWIHFFISTKIIIHKILI